MLRQHVQHFQGSLFINPAREKQLHRIYFIPCIVTIRYEVT